MILVVLIALLIVFAATYITYFGLIAKPDWSIYAYLIVWFAIPKAFRLFYLTAGAYDFPEGFAVFNLLETIAICGILVALLRHHKKWQLTESTASLRRFAWLFMIAGT